MASQAKQFVSALNISTKTSWRQTLSILLEDSIAVPALPNGLKYPQQFRDLALGMMIRSVGEEPKEFGFLLDKPGQQFAFPDDLTRQRALDKWRSRKQ